MRDSKETANNLVHCNGVLFRSNSENTIRIISESWIKICREVSRHYAANVRTRHIMLNKRERYGILKFFRICCIAGLLPAQIDLETWQLKVPSSTRKKRICIISYSLFTLHTLYKNVSLAHAYFFVPDIQVPQLVVHAILALPADLWLFWFFVAYIWNPELFFAYVRITLLDIVGDPLDYKGQLKKHWTRRLRKYSKQELIAMGCPYMCALAFILVCAAYIYDPSMRLLLYAALPSHLQNWATFGLCLLEEVRFMIMFISIAIPMWQVQIISFELVSHRLQVLIQRIRNGTRSAWSVCRALRILQLYVSMVNNVNNYLIFTWKFESISICILSGYAAIAHFREHPVFGAMYYDIFFHCALIYTVMYEKAFRIPELFGQAAVCALLHMRGNRNDIFRRQILSIPRTAIKVGHFHKMERASTLNFMNYVVTNIVSMLVAYA